MQKIVVDTNVLVSALIQRSYSYPVKKYGVQSTKYLSLKKIEYATIIRGAEERTYCNLSGT